VRRRSTLMNYFFYRIRPQTILLRPETTRQQEVVIEISVGLYVAGVVMLVLLNMVEISVRLYVAGVVMLVLLNMVFYVKDGTVRYVW
jgi:hypothetical protein